MATFLGLLENLRLILKELADWNFVGFVHVAHKSNLVIKSDLLIKLDPFVQIVIVNIIYMCIGCQRLVWCYIMSGNWWTYCAQKHSFVHSFLYNECHIVYYMRKEQKWTYCTWLNSILCTLYDASCHEWQTFEIWYRSDIPKIWF